MNLFKVGPFFYPTCVQWTREKKTSKSVLAFTYMTTKKQGGLLKIDLSNVKFSGD